MPELSREMISLLGYLLPGFLAAWIFYGLTSHAKPSQFERVVQALIFTLLIHTLVEPARWIMEATRRIIPINPWSTSTELVFSIGMAILFGIFLAYLTNTDRLHKRLRAIGFSTRKSYPSEWFGVLSEKITYVVLQLEDGRRLYGWPKEWPANPNAGFFYIMEPSWIGDDSATLGLSSVDGLLINVHDVKWVEFLNSAHKLQGVAP